MFLNSFVIYIKIMYNELVSLRKGIFILYNIVNNVCLSHFN